MKKREGYPPGVPCWIDVIHPDFDRTTAFYGGLFGWTFEVRTPAAAPFTYAYARLDGDIVAGVGTPQPGEAASSSWTHYVSVASVDATAATIEANGGSVLAPPMDIPRSGRVALCADRDGAAVGVWQAADLHGAETVNVPGSWNFSELHTPDADGAIAFYGAVFGWECDRLDFGAAPATWLCRVPGYGDFLAASDPDLYGRQEASAAPDGFADAVAWVQPYSAGSGGAETPHWSITFAVGDADTAFAEALALGAEAVTPMYDTEYTRQGTIRDPQGAVLNLSEFRPPS